MVLEKINCNHITLITNKNCSKHQQTKSWQYDERGFQLFDCKHQLVLIIFSLLWTIDGKVHGM
jgi:hypothetical protein